MEEETHTFFSQKKPVHLRTGNLIAFFDWRPGTVAVLMRSVLMGNGTESAKSYLLRGKSMELI
jgi:hypothetical protein